MDQAKELRTLMKLGTKKTEDLQSGTALSGKDKAKVLKLMREQQKEKDRGTTQATSAPRTASAVPKIPSSSGLPAGFFDNEPAPKSATNVASSSASAASYSINSMPSSQPTSNISTTTSNSSNNSSSSNNNSKSHNGKSSIVATLAPTKNAALPRGFFDNPVEDLNAHGISMDTYTAAVEKNEQDQLNAFLADIKQDQGSVEEAEAAAETLEVYAQEYEEEALQLAYAAKVIALRERSKTVIGGVESGGASACGGSSSSAGLGRKGATSALHDGDGDQEEEEALVVQRFLQEASKYDTSAIVDSMFGGTHNEDISSVAYAHSSSGGSGSGSAGASLVDEGSGGMLTAGKSAAESVDGILYQQLAKKRAAKRLRDAVRTKLLSTGRAKAAGGKHGVDDGRHKEESSGSDSDRDSDSNGDSDSDSETERVLKKPAATSEASYTPYDYMSWSTGGSY
jgi:hypothetical protein